MVSSAQWAEMAEERRDALEKLRMLRYFITRVPGMLRYFVARRIFRGIC